MQRGRNRNGLLPLFFLEDIHSEWIKKSRPIANQTAFIHYYSM